ncbi:UNVERIFIED_ORG: hypothetical protein M2435_001273 [Rhizobium sophorae]|uniref:hypothetical protein n=1 Tax=Rhizobium leguminosarum TaxID=384 RepID=UPI001613BDC3|nr:hypothetical protein [Rhizobium leguminosarum]MBB4520493.1 hypothetical protein [Rhizobium leguminosarum]MDH6658374.1 hypothetical protein [Rhizobium sophorae]
MIMVTALPASAKMDPVKPDTGALPRHYLPQPSTGIIYCVLPVPPEKRRWIIWIIRNKTGDVVAAGAMEIQPRRCSPAAGQ